MGLRGSGKSTLARSLSAAGNLPFTDLDDRVAAILGHPSATEAWTAHGEATFRATEIRALREALRDEIPIIALGGGTPMAPGARELLEPIKRARPPRLVYLRASPPILAARMRLDPARPSLTGDDPVAEVPAVFAVRDPVYRQLSDAVIDVEILSPGQATLALLALA
jgi:shikimate kinase